MTKPDYDKLIDEQTWVFIRRTQKAYPDDAVQLSIHEQRALYDAMCADFRTDFPAGIIATDHRIDPSFYTPPIPGCSIRRYHSVDNDKSEERANAQVIYLHGGGFVVGSLESHDDICAEIAHATGLPLVSVDYRLSPEHIHPAAYDDAHAAVLKAWAHNQKPIVLVGDSAGGNLAAAISHTLRGGPVPIIGQVLIYPGLGGDMESGSYLTHAHAPMLTTDEVRFYSTIRSGNDTSLQVLQNDSNQDPTQAPLRDSNFSQLPPTLVVSAACDPLSDDGKHYQQAINAAGGIAHWINEDGLVHGYLRARHQVDRARCSFDRILAGINALAKREWPYR